MEIKAEVVNPFFDIDKIYQEEGMVEGNRIFRDQKDVHYTVYDMTKQAVVVGEYCPEPQSLFEPIHEYHCGMHWQACFVPGFDIKLQGRELRKEKEFVNLETRNCTYAEKAMWCYSIAFKISQISEAIFKIEEQNNKGEISETYIDTSSEDVVRGVPFFYVYPFEPADIPLEEAKERFNAFLESSSFSEYRCIYNRYGLIIEAMDHKGEYEIYLSHPKSEKFNKQKEISVCDEIMTKYLNDRFSYQFGEYMDSKELMDKRIEENPPIGYYGNAKEKFILVNYLKKKGDDVQLVPYFYGSPVTIVWQTENFTPYASGRYIDKLENMKKPQL